MEHPCRDVVMEVRVAARTLLGMSVLLWWVPALIVVGIAWWRLRPAERPVREKDLARLQQVLRGDR